MASHNAGKLREFADLLGPFGVTARSAKDFGLPEPDETGTTFEENAYIKALAAARATGLPALSDDSGLVVDALGGQPGVYTANWAELPDGSRDFAMAMKKTEDALQAAGATEAKDRTGRFVAVICLAWPDGHAEYFRGEAEGTLVWPPRGGLGFGYDPVFLPEGHERTFGEMPAGKARLDARPADGAVAPGARLPEIRAGAAGVGMTQNDPGSPGFGVYVHWPFCAAKCPYCDFNSHVRHQPVDQERFARAFAAEIATMRERTGPRTVTCIFLGGGTPSLMKPETVGAVLDAVGRELGREGRHRDHAGGEPFLRRGGALPWLPRRRRQPRLARRPGARRPRP